MKKTWISEDKSQKYIGEFDGEKKHGQGTYYWVGLLEISGKFENDKLPNYGTVIKYDDYEYTGEMKNRDGRFNGKGVHSKFCRKTKGETHSYMHRDPEHMQTFDIERENDTAGQPVLKK